MASNRHDIAPPHIPQRGVVGIEKTESQNIKATGSPVTKQHSAGMIPTQFPGATPHQLRCIHGERTLKSLEAPSHENISHARQFQGEWMTPPADAAKASGGRARPGNRCHPWSRQVLVGPRALGTCCIGLGQRPNTHRVCPSRVHIPGTFCNTLRSAEVPTRWATPAPARRVSHLYPIPRLDLHNCASKSSW